jgi:flagellin
MAFQISSNAGAASAYSALAKVNENATKAQVTLATQKRINSVSDDTSGYRVGKELEAKVSQMKAAQSNIASAQNLLSTGESALSNINDLLIQIKSKISDASDPTKNLTALAEDVKALGEEISSIFTNTKFNDAALLSGTGVTGNFAFKTGTSETTTINFGTLNNIDLSTLTGATSATVSSISTVDNMITSVQDALGKIGNYGQRLDVKDSYLSSAVSNAESSISRLFDADMAQEQLDSTTAQIGGQVATAMLSQLNNAPQQILSLFQ